MTVRDFVVLYFLFNFTGQINAVPNEKSKSKENPSLADLVQSAAMEAKRDPTSAFNSILGDGTGQDIGRNIGKNMGPDIGQNFGQGLAPNIGQGIGQNKNRGVGHDQGNGMGPEKRRGKGRGRGRGHDKKSGGQEKLQDLQPFDEEDDDPGTTPVFISTTMTSSFLRVDVTTDSTLTATTGKTTSSAPWASMVTAAEDSGAALDCGPPATPGNGSIAFIATNLTAIATVTCDNGYILNGNRTLECTSSGTWEPSNYTCLPIECEAPHTPPGVFEFTGNTTYNTSRSVRCLNTSYVLHGEHEITCMASGNWSSTNYSCELKDCGEWNGTNSSFPAKQDAILIYNQGDTTYQSTVTAVCNPGFHVIGKPGIVTEFARCQASGEWSVPRYSGCERVFCSNLTAPSNVNIQYRFTTSPNGQRHINDTAIFTCYDDYTLLGYKTLRCLSTGNWSGKPPTCKQTNSTAPNCSVNVDYTGKRWNGTEPGSIATLDCPKGSDGAVSRQCDVTGQWMMPKYNCVRHKIEELSRNISLIKDNPTSANVESVLQSLLSVTSTQEKGGEDPLYGGEIGRVTDYLTVIANSSGRVNLSSNGTENFVAATSNLLDTNNRQSWQSVAEDNTVEKMLAAVDTFTNAVGNASHKGNKTINKTNIVLHVRPLDQKMEDLKFEHRATSIELPEPSLQGSTRFSAVVYLTLSDIMTSKTAGNTSANNSKLNSDVVSVNLDQWQKSNNFSVNIQLAHKKGGHKSPQCMFWDTSAKAWNSSGCRLIRSDSTSTTCQCDHLTNFAILMSPWIQDNVDTLAIDIISLVGCSISLLALVITVVTHIALWRYLKSDRAVILINLSVALVFSYIIFIAGVDQTDNKEVCTAVAALLHYIYLVVFFLMLAEGIEIAWNMLYVFTTHSRLKYLLPASWGVPLIIVGISMAATLLEGYGNKQFCWLSVDGGLIWAFVGPALLIIVINCVLLVLVMRAMFGTKSLSQKSKTERVKAGVRCLCILLPLMGCSWVIGLLYVNRDMAWIQYVFAVCNGLQGLVIFIFHCVLNQQVRSAIKRRKKRLSYSSNASKLMEFAFAKNSTESTRDIYRDSGPIKAF